MSGDGSADGGVGTTIDLGAPTTIVHGAAAPTSVAPGSGAAGNCRSNSTGPSAQACTVSKAPIVIGSVGTQTGVVGGAISPGPTGVKAWAAAVNAQGGIRCHPIKYVVADDGGDPARHQALVRQLVEQTKVVVFVQMNAPLTGQASVAYLSGKQIPVVGHEGGSPWFYDNPTYFAATSSGDVSLEGVYAVVVDAAKQANKTKIATISCVEAAICSRFNDVVPAFVPKYGGQIVYRAQASLVQPDYTAVCRAAKDAGAEVLVVFLDGSSVQRASRSCGSVEYHPQIVVPALSMIPALQSDPNLEGAGGGDHHRPVDPGRRPCRRRPRASHGPVRARCPAGGGEHRRMDVGQALRGGAGQSPRADHLPGHPRRPVGHPRRQPGRPHLPGGVQQRPDHGQAVLRLGRRPPRRKYSSVGLETRKCAAL